MTRLSARLKGGAYSTLGILAIGILGGKTGNATLVVQASFLTATVYEGGQDMTASGYEADRI
jgi:hypothetical protein